MRVYLLIIEDDDTDSEIDIYLNKEAAIRVAKKVARNYEMIFSLTATAREGKAPFFLELAGGTMAYPKRGFCIRVEEKEVIENAS